MLCWLEELASLAVCDDMVVFCSIKLAESCLIRGRDLRQNRNDSMFSR